MPANILLRFKAFLWDYLLIFSYMILLFILSVFLFPSIQNLFTGSAAQFFGFLLMTLPVSLYFIMGDSRIGKQSFGKKRVGIRVVDGNGAGISVIHSTIRTALKFLPWELSHFLVYRLVSLGEGDVPIGYIAVGVLIYGLMFLYILTAIFTKKKQAIYDLIVRTNVVKAQ